MGSSILEFLSPAAAIIGAGKDRKKKDPTAPAGAKNAAQRSKLVAQNEEIPTIGGITPDNVDPARRGNIFS